jgi:uncharacterized protein
MSAGVAIFVRTPQRAPVKTRLAARCGPVYAEGWYRRAAAAVAAVANASGLDAYWAVAETEALADEAWTSLPTLVQGDGGLGERMARVHAALVARHGAGILLGADTPQVTAALLSDAAAWLHAAPRRLVLGPAHDGGFWLFGANVAPPLAAWTSVAYSVADTGRDFRAALAAYGDWRTLPALTDVDHAADLPSVMAALDALDAPVAEQRALRDWMRAHAHVVP